MPARAAGLERVLTWAGEPLNTAADGLMNRRGKLDTIAVNGPEDVALDWDAIDWRFHEQNVIRLRRRIFKATREHGTRNALGACLSRVRGNPLARF
jgi:RNA-directed DNA polymerase